MFGSKRTDLERLREELVGIDADVAALDARAREQERRRTPGSGFDPSTKGGTDDTLRKIAAQRAGLMARRALLAPAVAALERLAAAQGKLPAILAAAQLPADPTEARGALDAVLAQAVAAEDVAWRLHAHEKGLAKVAETATTYPLPGHDDTRAARLRTLEGDRYRASLAAHAAVERLAQAQHSLDELAALEREAARALANLDAKPKPKAA